MTSKTKITMLSTILAVAVISGAFGYNEIIALDNDYQFDISEQLHADIIAKLNSYEAKNSDANFQKYSEKFLTEISLYDLGPEWNVLSVDTLSTIEPFEVTEFVVYGRLIDSPNNARQCEFETGATIIYDAKTGDVLEKNIPKITDECNEPLVLGKQSTRAEVPDWIQTADATQTRAYLTAGQGSPSGKYGGYGYLKVPTLDETANPDSIYNEQDGFIALTYNQLINGYFFQAGWLVNQSTKNIVFVDEYLYGNLNAHGVTTGWANNTDEAVYIQCGANDDYYITIIHNSNSYSHRTFYDCDNTNNNDSINNSVWLENSNSVSTSEWSDEIESTVSAKLMKEFDTKTTSSNWNSASNTYNTCPDDSSGSTSNISSSLGSGGTSVWTVSGIDDC